MLSHVHEINSPKQTIEYKPGPILDFKGNVQHIQKGHLTLTCFSQTDENLSISDNQFKQVSSSTHILTLMVCCSFHNLSFPLVDFENT